MKRGSGVATLWLAMVVFVGAMLFSADIPEILAYGQITETAKAELRRPQTPGSVGGVATTTLFE